MNLAHGWKISRQYMHHVDNKNMKKISKKTWDLKQKNQQKMHLKKIWKFQIC